MAKVFPSSHANFISIGSKFNGPCSFYDQANGKEMRETMPTLSDSEKFIQSLFVPAFKPKPYGEKPGEIVTREPGRLRLFVGKLLSWL